MSIEKLLSIIRVSVCMITLIAVTLAIIAFIGVFIVSIFISAFKLGIGFGLFVSWIVLFLICFFFEFLLYLST